MRYLIPIVVLNCCFAASAQEPVEEQPSSEVVIVDETEKSAEVGVQHRSGCKCSDKGKK